jgi:hypothetical protein
MNCLGEDWKKALLAKTEKEVVSVSVSMSDSSKWVNEVEQRLKWQKLLLYLTP